MHRTDEVIAPSPAGATVSALRRVRAGLSRRGIAYGGALACFLALSGLVYRDQPDANPGAFAALSEAGVQGLSVWRAENCHTCHQLYGFGGYLGPDLTHVAARTDEGTFRQIVRVGVGAMPGADLTDETIRDLFGFLTEMDQSGQGHYVAPLTVETWDRVFARLADVPAGAAVFQQLGCGQCHQPLRVGRMGAPDLTRSASRSHWAALAAVIRNGRGNMPAVEGADDLAVEDLLTLIQALHDNRTLLPDPAPRRGPLP